jgi:hypothetical protein
VADPHIVATADGDLICAICIKTFSASYAGPRHTARQQVLAEHQDLPNDEYPIIAPQSANEGPREDDVPYVNDFIDLDFNELLGAAEMNEPLAESFPTVLSGLIHIQVFRRRR